MTILAEILIYTLCLILALVAYVFGISDDFFGLLSDPTHSILASFFGGILIFLIGDRITAGIREHLLKTAIANSTTKAFSGIPQINNVIEYPSSDHAMRYLTSRIPDAAIMLNTKISKEKVEPRSDVGPEFHKAIKKAVKSGLCIKDIVSEKYHDTAEEFKNESDSMTGTYQYSVMQEAPPCFLNFIILEYSTGEKELMFGWATSNYMGTEQKAYMIRDSRVISYFEKYHTALFNT